MTKPVSADVTDADGSDLAILYPDVTLEIAGRTLTVREYRFIDGLRVRAKGKPLADDLQGMIDGGAVADATVEDYLDMLARHDVLVRQLIVDSIEGVDADWIEALDEDDGRMLMVTWWGVCGRFFVRNAIRKAAERALAAVARQQVGSTSSPRSQPVAMAPATNSSATTPSVN